MGQGGGHAPEFDYDVDKPAGSTVGYDCDNWLRSNMQHESNQYAIEHYDVSDDVDFSEDDTGRHAFITLKEQAAKPDLSGSTNRHGLYVKSDGVYVEKSDATESKLFDLTNNAFPTVPGFHNGTQAITFPTNGMATAKFMLGNSDTIAWFYLDQAPPGWKILATGADTVLAVRGGTQAYNVFGGVQGGTWTQPNHTLTTSEIPSHTHTLETSGRGASANEYGAYSGDPVAYMYTNHSTGATGGGSAHNHGSTYRPAASIGKLFQLDIA